jgi:signal transduction histidine kinase
MVAGVGGGEGREIDSDLRVALLTGASGWRDAGSRYTAPELGVVAVLAVCVVAVVTVLLVSAGLPARDAAVDGAARWVVAGVGTVTLLAAVAPSLAWPLGWRPRRPGPSLGLIPVRVAAVMVVVGCWTALLGPVAPVPIGVLGGVVGSEYTLTAWVLGARSSGLSWWVDFQRSSVNIGILACTVAIAVAVPEQVADILRVPLGFQVIAAAAAVTCSALERLRRGIEQAGDQAVQVALGDVHTRIAHWLHDELTSSLRLIRLGLHSGTLTSRQVGDELDVLDHRLRVLQLDEMIAAGPVQLAHVLQPFVRLAQSRGVDVVDVPRFDEASAEVRGPAGRLARRALGVLVPNAIAAGATELSFRITTVEPNRIEVEVEDDAGGFELDAVPAGRGLDGLRRDLGDGNLTHVRTERGSLLRVAIDRTGGGR